MSKKNKQESAKQDASVDEQAAEAEPEQEQLENNVDDIGDETEVSLKTDEEELDFDELADRVAELEQQNVQLGDRFMRAKAEADNTRRISAKEVEKARKFALEGFAKELLQVKDSLDQAAEVNLEEGSNEQLVKQMNEGLVLTTKQLATIFEKFHIEEINPEQGDSVDPELHQAMTMQPSNEVDANKIITAIQKGYQLNARLLRPAMVVVSNGPPKAK